MPRRAFDTFTVPREFWHDGAVAQAVAQCDIGHVFRLVQRATGASQTQLGIATGLTQPQVSEIVSGHRRVAHIDVLRRIVEGLSIPDVMAASLFLGHLPQVGDGDGARPPEKLRDATSRQIAPPISTTVGGLGLIAEQIERLRQGVHDAVSAGATTEADLDEWELTTIRHGHATRHRSAGTTLAELVSDLTDLQRLLARRNTASAQRRLTRVVAQMAGLMFLSLIKLNLPFAARNWARTARVAADEADDPTIRSWVVAQAAYVHYYAGSLVQSIDVARHAHALAGRATCVAVPLAAALEARALAALGREAESREAIRRAESVLALLDHEAQTPSAFGYNEAQLRFHEGNALTHLHDSAAARVAQARALELYPDSDYLDRTLVKLDLASCVAQDGDPTSAMTDAIRALTALPADQRSGIILLRGKQVLGSLPRQQRALSAAREFHSVLTAMSHREGDQP